MSDFTEKVVYTIIGLAVGWIAVHNISIRPEPVPDLTCEYAEMRLFAFTQCLRYECGPIGPEDFETYYVLKNWADEFCLFNGDGFLSQP